MFHGLQILVNKLNTEDISDHGNLLDGQSLSITNICQVGNQLKAVHNLATCSAAALDTKAQDTSETLLKILLGSFMRRVAGKTRV